VKILVIIGGINWGLIGVGILLGSSSDWNIVSVLLGGIPVAEAIVYILVGISAIVYLFGCKCPKCRKCNSCSVEDSPKSSNEVMKESTEIEGNM